MLLRLWVTSFLGLLALGQAARANTNDPLMQVMVDWGHVVATTDTIPTVMVVPSPILRRPSTTREDTFAALKQLHTPYTRYLAWFAHPRLAVAELDPPTHEKTFW